MRDAHLTPDLNNYFLNHKPHWSMPIISSIDWHLHNTVLRQWPYYTQKTIRQFIHDWIPVNAQMGSGHAISSICPLCNNNDETPHHFAQCNSIRATTTVWEAAALSVQSKATQPRIDRNLTRLLINTLQSWWTDQQPQRPHALDERYHQLFSDDQTDIG